MIGKVPASWVETGTALLGIPVQPEWVPSITEHLETMLRMGDQLLAHPLPDEMDPAPVFKA